ncbi:ABC transporter permease [Breoghania sp.]|uniref:ABC transporter permease n=1 Tax=Breoghania sp. TaxID=2065378 RepID=UPI0026368CF7|nr:ABC transporter permease [Breoghania sp.]MDJ0933058.1 ABC transporter permease [Breoghania sp.]
MPQESTGAPAREHTLVKRLLRRKLAAFALFLIFVIVGAVTFASVVAPFDPDEQFFDGLTLQGAPLPPGERFWLGTDLLGRYLLSRLIYGARTSLIIGIVASGIAVAVGALVGILADFFRGWVETVLMRFTDLMMAFPALLLAITLAALFRPSLWIVAMVNWVQMARVVYTETRSLSEREFIVAERAMGVGIFQVLFRHILPHLLSSIVVFGTLGISTTVLLEATLSYLGVGVQPPTPSWGNIIYENQTYFTSALWLVFFPGIAIIALALGFNMLGYALREVLDPTQKGKQ